MLRVTLAAARGAHPTAVPANDQLASINIITSPSCVECVTWYVKRMGRDPPLSMMHRSSFIDDHSGRALLCTSGTSR